MADTIAGRHQDGVPDIQHNGDNQSDQSDRDSDSDFDSSGTPDSDEAAGAGCGVSESSSDEDKDAGDKKPEDASRATKRGWKRARPAAPATADGGLDSGDEATLRESRRKRAQREGRDGERWDAEDEGPVKEGAGGFARTGVQWRNEYVPFSNLFLSL
jgi:hypothetical protein